MAPRFLDLPTVDNLRAVALRFGSQDATAKKRALAAAAACAVTDPAALLAEANTGGKGTRLAWLVGAIMRLRCTDGLRSQLWDAMQPFVVIRPGRTMLSRTFARGLPTPTYYHRDELPRRIDLRALLDLAL